MKTTTLSAALAGIISFLAAAVSAQVTVSTVVTNGLNEPYDVVVDASGNFYVSDSVNNRLVRVDVSTQAATTLAGIPEDPAGSNDGPPDQAHFNNPQGLLTVSIGGIGGLLVADSGNNLIRFVRFTDGVVTTLAGQTNFGPAVNAAGTNATFHFPIGLDQDTHGNVYIADWGNNTIRVLNLNDPALGITNVVISGTSFYRPTAVAFAGTNQLWVADTGNQMIKLITLATPASGSLTTYLGGYRLTGTTDASFGPNARFDQPSGILWLSGVGLLISDTLNNSIRLATNNPAYGAANYAVVTFAGTSGPGNGGLQDGSAATAEFHSPVGLAQLVQYNAFLVADLKNNAIRRIQNGPAPVPVPAPEVGWVAFTNAPLTGLPLSVLITNQPFVFNNDVIIATTCTAGAETLFTYGVTPGSTPDPTTGSTAPCYQNGVSPDLVPPTLLPPQPTLTINAIGVAPGTGRPNSAMVSATFQFETANPLVIGNNAAWFTVTDLTTNALMYYTMDGTDPATSPSKLGPITSGATFSLYASNVTFKVCAFRDSYQPSATVTKTFSAANYNPFVLPPPVIGWVAFTNAPVTELPFSELMTNPLVLYNDVTIEIMGPTNDNQISFTSDGINWFTLQPPSYYQDGTSPAQVPASIASPQPYLTIEAIATLPPGSGPARSPTATVPFQFVTANPMISGNNAAQFTIGDITANAHLYYTLDGSDPSPTNGVDLGTVATPTNVWLVGFPMQTNTWFKVRAFHDYVNDNYQPSAVVSNLFYTNNFLANTISFGFASGEASSQFIGSPGQTFYAPVTLSPLPNTEIYSLQFNVTVNPGGGNPGPAMTPGAYSFQSFLVKPIPGTSPVEYIPIPPAMYLTSATNPAPVVPTNQVFQYNNSWFESLIFSDTNGGLNLLGVGWLESYYMTNLYDTLSQDLIAFSKPHNTFFIPAMGKVVLGGYAFQIPPNATNSQTYQIQIGRPSATDDGIGAPGSAVYIATPTNGSLTAGAMNSIKIVTAGQRKYVAGDCAPFGWFNAGDFGDTNLDNSDVEQVFESAIYYTCDPPPNSDFYDSMDSCGGLGVLTPNGYYVRGSTVTDPATLNLLFDGNDTTINQMPFGDGNLDVCDVYVTFRRSLDPSLTWWRRFWTNGVLAAEAIAQPKSLVHTKDAGTSQPKVSTAFLTNPPSVNFAAADFSASAGQVIQVPVTATIFGNYPLRVLMLNLSVVPLDGSPALTSAVSFTSNPALGTPALSASIGNGNYAASWLSNSIPGLTGNATIGTVTVTIPANAPSSAAYAVHFDHASASPNGIGSFPKQTLTGLITLSSRTNSSYSDGIPDSWRLRWFGTIYNALSAANADACGDGINNWHKYIAGTDPTDPKAYPHLLPTTPTPAGATAAIHWPSVGGKQYVIERSASLFPGSWTAIATNTGTGTEMEFDDTTSTNARFYRVRILP